MPYEKIRNSLGDINNFTGCYLFSLNKKCSNKKSRGLSKGDGISPIDTGCGDQVAVSVVTEALDTRFDPGHLRDAAQTTLSVISVTDSWAT